jgi:hypothetical protein
MKIGETYYFVQHAYYHFLAEVAEILGPKHVRVTRCVRVHSCRRDFTSFFRDGVGTDTAYTHWTDTELSGWICAALWHHPIPELPHATSKSRRG